MQVETPDVSDEVLECPSLRQMLRPRPSPFCVSSLVGCARPGDCQRMHEQGQMACQGLLRELPCSQVSLSACPQVSNNFGGGFVSDEDRVALSSIKFASADSAGAKCISNDNGHSSWLEASMEQLCVPLPPWSLRAGARETIWHNPVEVNAASESGGSTVGFIAQMTS